MSAAERYDWIAAGFTRRVAEVPEGAWDNPAPVEGWVARDVVRHLVEWLPAYFGDVWGVDFGTIPDVDADPAAAWAHVDAVFRRALADPAAATVEKDTRMGRQTFASELDTIGTSDVFMHTWDLARAAGGDEKLDEAEAARMFAGMEPMDEMLRASGQYGPRVAVPDDADPQTKLLAFIGRQV